MPTRFPTVPIEVARQALLSSPARLRPLVLVVDDEPVITQTLSAILNARGLTVLTASDGFAALDLALLIPPEVLITDVSMPGMNGVELAVQVKHLVPDCGILLFSGHATSTDITQRLAALGREFVLLSKPVHPAEMLDRVFELLDGAIKPPKAQRAPSLYDFLSSAGRGKEISNNAWAVSARARLRTAASAGRGYPQRQA